MQNGKNPIRIKALVKGLLTYVPVMSRYANRGTGGTVSARYCYSVWLRHLVWAHRHGLTDVPGTVAELGPGDSLGTGLAALLSGSQKYYALDVKKYASSDRNLRILDELVDLYQRREPIPDASEFPRQLPLMDAYDFPRHILTEERLAHSLGRDRLDRIRGDLLRDTGGEEHEGCIVYFAPWYDPKVVREESVDFVLSQAVMEHVTDLDHTYEALRQWLKPEGWASHVIDFRCHHTATQWNGHWAFSDVLWRLIQGKRAYLINREPYSTHMRLLDKHKFRAVCDRPFRDASGIERSQLAPRFQTLSDDDLTTWSAFIQTVKTV